LSSRYLDWLNDQALMRYSEQRHRVHSMESCRAYWQSFRTSPHYFWAIEEAEIGLGHIGNLNAYFDEKNGLADMGILIGQAEAKGQKYGQEAWKGACDFLFQQGIRKITAGTLATNTAMLRLARNVGMVEDGIRKRHYLNQGQEVDVIHLALFKSTRLQRGDDERTCDYV